MTCKILFTAGLLFLAACGRSAQPAAKPPMPGGEDRAPWSGIEPGDTVHFSGTEPFWAGTLTGTSLVWQTPDNQTGVRTEVKRFAGRNGLGVSGMLEGTPVELAVSEATCSDGMSDRTYPFSVTARRGGETLRGCGWSDAHRFTGEAHP